MTTTCPEAFLSAPIKLAAKISGARYNSSKSALEEQDRSSTRTRSPANLNSFNLNQTSFCSHFRVSVFRPTTRKCSGHLLASLLLPLLLSHYLQVSAHLNSQLINHDTGSAAARDGGDSQLRHHAHYLNFVPSATFSYQEGRQLNGRSLELNELTAIRPQDGPSKRSDESASSHIYKRSSAVLMPPTGSMSLLVQQAGHHTNQHQNQNHHQHLAPMSRRMMSNVAPPAQSMSLLAASQAEGSLVVTNANQNNNKQTNWLGVVSPSGNSARIQHQEGLEGRDQQSELLAAGSVQSVQHSQVTNQRDQEQRQQASGSNNNRKQAEQEAELLRQKQHIQYHDQWPSMAGKCHKRTLNFCASVLPFNTTTFPNIIGDTNRFEVKRSLPFFGFLAKSSCNKRLDELLCLLLEPPCSPTSGSAIPPCKKFCRLALEGCNEYIPATLALSSVFDCRQYPDSNEPGVCINLAQGSKCAQDEFKCPDKTCIPRKYCEMSGGLI